MKCPVCGTEMQVGRIPTGKMLSQFIPDGEARSFWSYNLAKKGTALRSTQIGMQYEAEAHYCPNCKIVLAETD